MTSPTQTTRAPFMPGTSAASSALLVTTANSSRVAEFAFKGTAQHLAEGDMHFLDPRGRVRGDNQGDVGKLALHQLAAVLAREGRAGEAHRPCRHQRLEDI